MRRPPAVLALEDGTAFFGTSFGSPKTATGEICFNTGMTGYQEVLTDPSYHGQIVSMTTPQIGNTGTNDEDDQSRRPWVAGFIVRDLTRITSSWRATDSLDAYLKRHDAPGLSDIDTRRLTRHLRDRGAMRGAVSSEVTNADELVDIARNSPSMIGLDLAKEVTTELPYTWTRADVEAKRPGGFAAGAETATASAELLDAPTGDALKIAAYDFGMKQNILDLLVASGADVTVVPANTRASTILDGRYDGVFLSNGPGDPEPVTYAIDAVRGLLGKVPVFGICLGHQILGLALGARTYKLPFGHRGANHPVKRLSEGTIEITCQNHGFAVAPESIADTKAELTHVNLNDNTVEGLEVPGVAYSVQYHPESGPGPHDSRYLFSKFRQLIHTFEPTEMEVNA